MTRDMLVVVAIAAVSCVLVGAAGVVLLHRLRRRALTALLVTAALLPVAAVAAAVLASVQVMFISEHDSQVLWVALGAALLLAVAFALVIGRWLVGASRELGRGVRGLVDELAVQSSTPLPVELAELATELETTRVRLEQSRLRERSLERSRRELVAFMSHDLRSPLAGLRALTEGLEDGVVDDVPAALGQMRCSVDRMSGLVSDLFELSRLQVEVPGRPRVLVSLREVAEDVIGECHEQARALGVEMHARMPDDDRLPVLGAADELERVLANLISNALRHTGSGRRIEVRGDRGDDGRVRVCVLDSCGGIPAEELGRVFDVGWRGDPERTPGDGRSGLGLAIARGVVEAHSGTLHVANTDGGCRFEVTLPSAEAAWA